jgi:hypothetical protein
MRRRRTQSALADVEPKGVAAMGQAGAAPDTLPDPNEPAPPAAASADDLLAQLAGEEIDRLLAESDDGAPAPGTVPTSDAQAAPIVESPTNVATDSIDTVEKIGDQLDQLLKEIETPKPAAEPEAPAARTTIAQLGAATSNNEVSALLGEQLGSRADDAIDDGTPLPIYVRALEIINSPFAAMPDALREFLGKVAILTMFNSIAVLMYVLIFRRH